MTDAGGSYCELLADDQAEDRAVVAGTAAYAALRRRDADRRKRVLHLLAAAPPSTAQDFYAAAWVLNHGDRSDEAYQAHQLATRADQLGYRNARWLAAAALDRSLMYSGRPQKFGSNIVPDGQGWRLWDVDPATTDAERAQHDMPPLEQMRERAAAMTDLQPDFVDAPQWMRDALARWATDRPR
ncbi:hypothetical protein [Brevundimonas sp. PAMC22021]|uniref:hypothetical protein n=1 Tax=Brevundimonas sp. PAMC22021 TaxID=2861285 RepID=UPI001C634E01|nr:hypothetical protein [Brevundimonas sp. PAMC22021]QYF85780.1 hypothetical protein KY493_07810 [Brevundimonas sp. PAMC22021]